MIYIHSRTGSLYTNIDGKWHFKFHASSKIWTKFALQYNFDASKLIGLSPVVMLLYDLDEVTTNEEK